MHIVVCIQKHSETSAGSKRLFLEASFLLLSLLACHVIIQEQLWNGSALWVLTLRVYYRSLGETCRVEALLPFQCGCTRPKSLVGRFTRASLTLPRPPN